MLDLDRIRSDPGELRRMLKARFMDPQEADSLLKQDVLRRKLATDSQAKKTLRNRMSRQIGSLKQSGGSGEEIAVILSEMRALGTDIAAMDVDIAELEDKISLFLLSAPNYPHASVPVGKGEKNNAEVYRSAKPNAFSFEAKPFWNIGSKLKILDFDDAVKLGGNQPTSYRGLGAKLERAVADFLLDTHIRSGCQELTVPYLIMGDGNADGSRKDGSPPPEQDMSAVQLYRERVFAGGELPVRRCAVSAGFRSDVSNERHRAGGLVQRQSDAVELMTVCTPGDSYSQLSAMTEQAQKTLQLLGLPYRVTLLCTGEMPRRAAKTYVLEVWLPGSGRYTGVAAYSNCEAYLARRLDIRFRETATGEPRLCHTLSGSGLSVGRTAAAILENHQNEDGSVTVPEALRPYMHTDIIR